MRVEIITTRHWEGDARLNRHSTYLESGGHVATIRSFRHLGRFGSLIAAVRAVLGSPADVLILPDPEFFAVGAISARMSGKRPVIDIHEDYPKVSQNRSWIPDLLKPIVMLLATAMVGLGRLAAWRVIVAAPQLARSGDHIVLNVPDPSTLPCDVSRKDPSILVYVGDVTVARGAVEMVRALAGLPDHHRLVLIGPASEETRTELERVAGGLGVSHRVELTGRLDHDEAWRIASRAQFGLSLLRDTPAYRAAVATKLWEYMACGLVPLVTDLPGQAAFVARLDPRLVCSTPESVAETVSALTRDETGLHELGSRARDLAMREWDGTRPDRELRAVFNLDR